MKDSGGGSIVNISSIGSLVPDVSRLAYTLSKAAVNALTKKHRPAVRARQHPL